MRIHARLTSSPRDFDLIDFASGIHSHRHGFQLSLALLALGLFSSCITNPSAPPAQEPSTITLSSKKVVLTAIDEWIRIDATVLDQDGEAIKNALVFWRSENESIATVSNYGVVTAVESGTTLVTVTSGDAVEQVMIAVELMDTALLDDRDVLVSLYNATGGAHWRYANNWLSDKPLGEWYRVWVNLDNRVTQLNLDQNSLDGTLPAELGHLGKLTLLDLGRNRLSGDIPPEIGLLVHLTSLDLRRNQFSGEIPPEIGLLVHLTRLDLGANRLNGVIPPGIGSLVNLTRLDLGTNLLSGEIPTEIGRLLNLTSLNLGINWISGEIPAEIGDLGALGYLDLRRNQLSGKIPPEIGDLGALEYLDLHRNQLSGKIPPEIGKLTKLRSLNLTGNESMSGPLPVEITTISSLGTLALDSTKICVPNDDLFDEWLDSIENVNVNRCSP